MFRPQLGVNRTARVILPECRVICDSQDLTLQAILSNGVATVRQILRRMFSAMAAERAKAQPYANACCRHLSRCSSPEYGVPGALDTGTFWRVDSCRDAIPAIFPFAGSTNRALGFQPDTRRTV